MSKPGKAPKEPRGFFRLPITRGERLRVALGLAIFVGLLAGWLSYEFQVLPTEFRLFGLKWTLPKGVWAGVVVGAVFCVVTALAALKLLLSRPTRNDQQGIEQKLDQLLEQSKPAPPAPEIAFKIDTARLPVSGPHFVARKQQLDALDKAWNSDKTNIIGFQAWGGVGKLSLIHI